MSNVYIKSCEARVKHLKPRLNKCAHESTERYLSFQNKANTGDLGTVLNDLTYSFSMNLQNGNLTY